MGQTSYAQMYDGETAYTIESNEFSIVVGIYDRRLRQMDKEKRIALAREIGELAKGRFGQEDLGGGE